MAKAKTNYPPNDASRRERTWKAGTCQRCEAKVPVAKQKRLERDDSGEVHIRKAQEGASHYCDDCSKVRLVEKTRVPGQKAKSNGAKSSKKASTKKAGKAKSGRKRTVKKPAAKSAAAKSSDPF